MKYEDLIVWQKSMVMVTDVYQDTKSFPVDEKFALTNQLRRAAVSVPANIAEGHGRKYTKAYLNFLSIAVGSLTELETLLKISYNLQYLSKKKLTKFSIQIQEIGRMLSGLIAALQNKLRIKTEK